MSYAFKLAAVAIALIVAFVLGIVIFTGVWSRIGLGGALVVPSAAGASADDVSRSTAATVERIIDGDTLVVRGGARVRLIQIDAPEAGEECYASASARGPARPAPPG